MKVSNYINLPVFLLQIIYTRHFNGVHFLVNETSDMATRVKRDLSGAWEQLWPYALADLTPHSLTLVTVALESRFTVATYDRSFGTMLRHITTFSQGCKRLEVGF